ncbi:hypothetical protein GCM10010492_54610 [Saccharothrix mutabilis subsp. mutabilis]|uniref:Berberine/berberine-like domain-containing protein n=1 Tax=Saccharothrix mutabilis subsp. mutabilis TaxID=66855 RepID=A0ABN0UEI4_9PSEU
MALSRRTALRWAGAAVASGAAVAAGAVASGAAGASGAAVASGAAGAGNAAVAAGAAVAGGAAAAVSGHPEAVAGGTGARGRWARLRARLSGGLLLPGDAGYDSARLPFNSLFDHRRPAAIARCARPEDVPPERVTREVDRVQSALAGLVGAGTYVNYPDPLQEDWATTAYRHNLPRLRAVARRYDPDGVLRFPQAVR